ncbi:MAG: Crp/Fnr family transcriptional regulator [Fimbriimonadaceae bacterium]|nr:Crp/Fnr family transcriptional regulator [Fimbriimonadaceae bacterium]
MSSNLPFDLDVPLQKPSIKAVLESCSVLNALTPEERSTILEQGFMAYADRGEVIWLAGAPSQNLAVVGTGFVKMTRHTPHGTEVALELLGPGQCFGLLVAIEGREYPLSAVAVTKTWYLKIPTRSFLEIYNSSSNLRDHILRTLGPRLRRAQDMMARMSMGRMEQRLAAVLLILMDSYGQPQKLGTRIVVPLTRQDLAEMAGTTVETAIRIMSKMQKEGIVKTDRQMITVLDPASLSELLLT